jgi:hypothetical protein
MDIQEYINSLSFCPCKDCKELQEKLIKQLEHPFYKGAKEFRKEIENETMVKAAKKYKEPFNPFSWTIEELAKHAMAENYDQQNYIFGMYEVMKQLEAENEKLKSVLSITKSEMVKKDHYIQNLQAQIEYWGKRANG